eukprot:4521964-Pleurochrysis_carterae.AAC.1
MEPAASSTSPTGPAVQYHQPLTTASRNRQHDGAMAPKWAPNERPDRKERATAGLRAAHFDRWRPCQRAPRPRCRRASWPLPRGSERAARETL